MKSDWLKVFGATILLLFGFQYSLAAEESVKNVGFLPSNIWYSKDPFFAGDKIRVYTAIFNGSDGDLEGSVEFYDNGSPIGKSGFSLAGGGRLRDVWIDWTATNGNHVISAKIINPKISAPGEEPRLIIVANAETGTNERVVDFDINKNGVADGKEIVKNAIMTGESVVLSKIDGVTQKINEIVPIKPVIETVKTGIENVDQFRGEQEKKVSSAVINVKKELESLNAEDSPKTGSVTKEKPVGAIKDKNVKDGGAGFSLGKVSAEKPFKYVYLFFLSVLEYILKIKLLFYGLILSAAFFIGRFVYRKVLG